MNAAIYETLKVLIQPVYRIGLQLKVEGIQNVPRTGPVILCANHISNHDPIVLGLAAPRRVSFMAKEELFRFPIVKQLVTSLGAFPVKRGQADRAALKRSVEVLEQGGCFGIFPEGTRSRTGELGKPLPGTAYLALKQGAPVIPVGISGSYKAFGQVTVRFGAPVDLSPYKAGKVTSAQMDAAADDIMDAIARLV